MSSSTKHSASASDTCGTTNSSSCSACRVGVVLLVEVVILVRPVFAYRVSAPHQLLGASLMSGVCVLRENGRGRERGI